MGRWGALVATIMVVGAAALFADGAAAAPSVSAGSGAGAASPTAFRPRIGRAMGLTPPVGHHASLMAGDPAAGALTPVLYHGGVVMSGGVTVHTIFWAPSGFAFQGSPGAGIPTYEGLIRQFFTDVAVDSAAPGTCSASDCNVFTVERQYGQGTSVVGITPGTYSIAYNPAVDSINDTDPYPSKSSQCASPAGTAVCITDQAVAGEVDHVVQSSGGARGLHDVWFVFLPPGVDECITAGACGTNSFAGYHAVENVSGHGATIYAVAIDPIIETPVPAGSDPQGYPDAEVALDIAAHEVNEAITDPLGDGWMDPNGFEVGDKCDTGPQLGTPLGFAPDGSPYNQVINGHQYLLQQEWANSDSGGNADCVQASASTSTQLPLPAVSLRQFDPLITGNVNRVPGGGIGVRVSLVRANPAGDPVVVAHASTITGADGSWQVWLWPHAPGDDRDEIVVDYSGAGAPQPSHQVILTGNGGNPFTEAGWMGWVAMDHGSSLSNSGSGSSLALAPCFQAGTLSFAVDGVASPEAPNGFCNTASDVASQQAGHIGRGDTVTWTSTDNRAFDAPNSPTPNLFGGLVSLTVPVGEPGSVSSFPSPLTFTPGGFPTCLADLELQAVGCSGLVPGAQYKLVDRRERATVLADGSGTVFAPLRVRRGDAVRLSNGERTLSTLHVANLRVAILGDEKFVEGGTCQPGAYYGAPLTSAPTTAAAGLPSPQSTGGVALTGEICPLSGRAAGLPSSTIAQSDELSGGQTETEVPDIQDTSPIEGETVYGGFTALAESGLALANGQILPTDGITTISLRVLTATGRQVLTARNVDTPRGVRLPGLRPGDYLAIWTLKDRNGDTRTIATRFISARGTFGPKPRTSATISFTGAADVSVVLRFAGERQLSGSLRLSLSRRGTLVALGHGRIRGGRATAKMRVLRRVSLGAWALIAVVSAPPAKPVTLRLAVARAR